MVAPIEHLIGNIGHAIGSLFSAPGSPASPTAPTAPPPAAPPIQSPTGTSDTFKNASGPSFLAAAAAPSQAQQGAKSLLGQ